MSVQHCGICSFRRDGVGLGGEEDDSVSFVRNVIWQLINALRTQQKTNKAKAELGCLSTCRKQGNCSVHLLPYSEHSSLAELQEFVSALNPREVVSPQLSPQTVNEF